MKILSVTHAQDLTDLLGQESLKVPGLQAGFRLSHQSGLAVTSEWSHLYFLLSPKAGQVLSYLKTRSFTGNTPLKEISKLMG